MKEIIKLYIFIVCSISTLLQTANAFENIFIHKGIEENFSKFTAVEIVRDFEVAINEYNAKRKSPKSLAQNIPAGIYFAQFETGTRNQKELPEIIKGEGFYTISVFPDKIQFNIDLILKNQFFLNGKLHTLDQFKASRAKSVSSSFNLLIDFFLSPSVAGELFVSSPDSTRLLIASVIALDGTFEKIGITCILTCKEKTSKINNDRLIARIREYKQACEQSSERQTEGYKRYQQNGDLVELLLISNTDFEKTFGLLNKMSAIQKKGEEKAIVSKVFENTMAQKTCFDQIRSTFKLWFTNAQLLTDEAEALNQRARKTCDAISGLKSCLSDFHAQSTAIYNSSSREYKQEMKREQTKVPSINGISR